MAELSCLTSLMMRFACPQKLEGDSRDLGCRQGECRDAIGLASAQGMAQWVAKQPVVLWKHRPEGPAREGEDLDPGAWRLRPCCSCNRPSRSSPGLGAVPVLFADEAETLRSAAASSCSLESSCVYFSTSRGGVKRDAHYGFFISLQPLGSFLRKVRSNAGRSRSWMLRCTKFVGG